MWPFPDWVALFFFFVFVNQTLNFLSQEKQDDELIWIQSAFRNLNFTAIGSEDDEAYSSFSKKAKSARDPQSHRIIEKRRRDRMNNCLADLSRLLPAAYMKKGRGRIEKTEIIEMTIKHMKHLQVHACKEMGKPISEFKHLS